ncbi:hypothetical protein PhCBS80983_g05799 [Powellomyces hirtus]|uniref:Uncharacterized protein n=1 Tax=Powellomyces hirtus TaxID=109895 RepID=A0A507DTD9_9FUNG|nr:hypothetical protein PhCBS80983_g05799 [Powellomyces hirtus]
MCYSMQRWRCDLLRRTRSRLRNGHGRSGCAGCSSYL